MASKYDGLARMQLDASGRKLKMTELHLFISERFPTLATNSCRLFPQNP